MANELRRRLAREDFQQARRDGQIQDLLARVRGQTGDLLPFEEVRQKLHAFQGVKREQRLIPVDAIIGSVGRYHDFNRDFLPRTAQDQDRWAKVSLALEDNPGLPPISVYQIGEAYFVKDGNHRVSIAKRHGQIEILAEVTVVNSPVALSAEADMEEVICLAEYANFLTETGLADQFPEADLATSEPGGYAELLQQIEMVHFLLQKDSDREVSYVEAMRTWYLDYYLTTAEIIQTHNLLRNYPERRVTDLYVWLHRHRSILGRQAGWQISTDAAAADLNARAAGRLRNMIQRTIDPDVETGAWREAQLNREKGHIFSDILVMLDEDQPQVLLQALAIASEEGAHLLGLHVKPEGNGIPKKLRDSFGKKCLEAGVDGQLAFGRGDPADILKARARWADLAILPPPGPATDAKKYHRMIENCFIPVWVVRGAWEGCRRVLLAFDGSQKANEALFMTAYLSMFWEFTTTVLTVEENGVPPEALQNAVKYLENYGLDARPVSAAAPAAETILNEAEQFRANLIMAGSYHSRRLLGSVVGHTVDTLLQHAKIPILICR